MPNDENIIDRIFSEAEAFADLRGRARQAISEKLPQQECSFAIADIAAHHDASPASGGDPHCVSSLADDPNAADEFESADAWLAKIRANQQPVPDTLLRLARAAPVKHALRSAEQPARQAFIRRKSLRAWGGAIAASLIACIAGYAAHDLISDKPDAAMPIQPVGSEVAQEKLVPNDSVATVQPDASNSQNPAAAPAPVVTTPSAPIPLNSHAVTAADYPPASIRLQEHGTVKVRYLVLRNGTVSDCQVVTSSGFSRLDDAACTLVTHWLFKPATVMDHTPVEWWMDASVVYQLNQGGLPAQAQVPRSGGAISTRNLALVKAITDATAAAKAQNWTVALEKAKEADAITDDKPAALNPQIHQMIISYAINARDYATAMAQIEKNIEAGEGNRIQNLRQALGIAITAKDRQKTEQFATALGLPPSLPAIMQALGSGKSLPMPPIPPVAMTPHVVTADDYPADSVHALEQGKVSVIYRVEENGSVGECRVTMSSGFPRLDDAACTMVTQRWKFKPATQNGIPVSQYLTAEVIFQLK